MDIVEACRMIRQCHEAFRAVREPPDRAATVAKAVQVLKTYLQMVRADGKRIHELEFAEHLVFTPEGMRWVEPFLLSAEAIVAFDLRKQLSEGRYPD